LTNTSRKSGLGRERVKGFKVKRERKEGGERVGKKKAGKRRQRRCRRNRIETRQIKNGNSDPGRRNKTTGTLRQGGNLKKKKKKTSGKREREGPREDSLHIRGLTGGGRFKKPKNKKKRGKGTKGGQKKWPEKTSRGTKNLIELLNREGDPNYKGLVDKAAKKMQMEYKCKKRRLTRKGGTGREKKTKMNRSFDKIG